MHHSGDDSSITGNYQLLVILPGQLPVITWPQNPLPGNGDAIVIPAMARTIRKTEARPAAQGLVSGRRPRSPRIISRGLSCDGIALRLSIICDDDVSNT